MNLRQLEAFVQVAERKSFSETARFLYLSQPTVSAHIAELEKELNTRLFIRYKRHVELTEKGTAFYEYAKKVTILLQQIEDKFLNHQESGNNTEISIAASSIPSQYLLPEILSRFQTRYPKIKFKVKETDSADVINIIRNHQADIGFTGTKIYGKSCKYTPFCEDELVVITPNNEYYQKKLNIAVAKWIKDEPLILRENGSGTRKEILKIFNSLGLETDELQIVACMENTETIKQSVSKGMGISILSSLAVRDRIDHDKVLVFPLSAAFGKRSIYLVYNKDFIHSTTTAKFLDTIKKMYPECKI